MDDSTFLTNKITAAETQIDALEAASLSLTSGEIQSYTIDTGQSRQVVTVHNLATLQRLIDSLYNRRATLRQRLYGCGSTLVRPGW